MHCSLQLNEQYSWWTAYLRLFALILFCSISSDIRAQTVTLGKTLTNQNQDPEVTFNFQIDIACSSSTGPCRNIVVRDTLPAYLEFLNFSSPLPSGVASATYDVSTREAVITMNNNLGAGSSVQVLIQVQFPDGTLTGSQAINYAYATSTNAGSAQDSAMAICTNGETPGDFPDWKWGDGSQISGGYQYWSIEVGNIGFTDIDNYTIIDTIPPGITMDQVRSPYFTDVDHSGDIFYMRSDNPGVWVLWYNFNMNTRETHYVSGLGLPGGVYISQLKLELGTVSANGSFNPYIYPNTFERSWILYGIESGSRSIGDSYTNCANYTGTTGGSPISDVSCRSTSIIAATNEITGGALALNLSEIDQTTYSIEDTMIVGLEFASPGLMGNNVVGGVMTAILPPNVSYVPGSWYYEWGSSNTDGHDPAVETGVTIDGREIVRLVFDSTTYNNAFNIEPTGSWEGFRLNFRAFVEPAAVEGLYDIEYYYNATEMNPDNCGTNDTNNYLNGFAATYCYDDVSMNIVRPPGAAGLESRMEVIGTLDTDYSQYPNRALTVPGGISDYMITIKNPNAARIDRLVFITVLPHIGDSEVLDMNTPRFSEWQPTLAEAVVTGIPQLDVEYSTVSNPCRDDLAGSNPTPFPTGCNTANWSATPPTDITDVTALRFDYGNTNINQNDSLVVSFSMRSPVDALPDTSIAWNSFAYSARNFDSKTDLLPAEPIKVGIELRPGNVPIVGDYVWQDSVVNGRQDASEQGIDGIRVELYEDVDLDGIAEPGGPDTMVLWTVTSAGGKYLFSDFDYGYYFIQFSDIPSGFNPTYQDATSDDKDSDGLITDVMLFDNSVETYDVDLGLYNGILPEDCTNGSDDDGDGLIDCNDPDCYLSTDYDGDGIGTLCDIDDDNDGIPDVDEEQILTFNYIPPCTTEPEFDFSSPTLESGDSLQVGAVWRYSNVIPGVDALVTIEDLVNLYLPLLDDDSADPTYFKTRSAFSLIDANTQAYSQWIFNFVIAGTSTDTTLEAVNLLYIDIDGNSEFSEFNWTEYPTSFTYNDPNELSFTYDNAIEAVGDTTEYPMITDSFPQVNFYVRYAHINQFRARFGVQSSVDNTSSEGRFHGLIFKCPDTYTSPVTVSFDVDEDGVPNYLDLDSDNDGLLDVYESGHGLAAGANGRILNVNANVGTNGLDDRVETFADSDTINYAISDSEPTPDYTFDPYELDSDGDGCYDTQEESISDGDMDGLAGTGTLSVDPLTGLIASITYVAPPNNFWQNSAILSSICDTDDDLINPIIDLDDDNDGIPDTDECATYLNLDFENAASIRHNGSIVSTVTTLYPNDTLYFQNIGSLTSGDIIDGRIVLQSVTSGAEFDPSPGYLSLRTYEAAIDDYLTFTIEVIDAATSNVLTFNGKALFKDIDSQTGQDMTEMLGFKNNQWAVVGANIQALNYQNGGGPSNAFINYGLNPAVVGSPSDWTDEPNVTPSNQDHWVDVIFSGFSNIEMSFGVTGSNGFTSGARDLYLDEIFFLETCDTDGDGVADLYDLDSDNDGIYDIVESGHNAVDANNDGIIDGAPSAFGLNGLFDGVETFADSDTINYAISDSETIPDGTFDPYELDSDDDGCFDVAEAEFADVDEDGLVNTGTPVVDIDGLVTTHTYTTPPNAYWQDPLFNVCEGCKTAIMNPHIMYYRSKE